MTLRARWVTLRARWVTRRARWLTLRGCWCMSSLGDAKSSLGDAESSLGDAESSLGDAKSSLGDAKSSLGDTESSLVPLIFVGCGGDRGVRDGYRSRRRAAGDSLHHAQEPRGVLPGAGGDALLLSNTLPFLSRVTYRWSLREFKSGST